MSKIHFQTALSLFLLIFCSSCHSTTANSKTDDKANITASFDTLLSRFQDRSLPIEIHPCPGGKEFSNDTEFKHIDSAIGAPFNLGFDHLAYGKIKTNGDYSALITLGLADCLGTNISTFGKSGKIIASQYIGIGQCGSGPGFTCSEVVKINKDYSIYAADSITEQEVDSNYAPVAGGKIFSYVVYKKGKLLPDGHIELTAEMRDTFKIERDTSAK